jgi:hypothetical protein
MPAMTASYLQSGPTPLPIVYAIRAFWQLPVRFAKRQLEGQPASQFRVFFDFAAEEVADGKH